MSMRHTAARRRPLRGARGAPVPAGLTPQSVLELLKSFWHERQRAVNARWKRTLPFADYVVDRWEKARALRFGRGTSVYDSAVVLGEVEVGENTWIGPFVVLDGSGKLTIGSHCSISAGVQIYTHDTVGWATSGGKAAVEYAPTIIGDNCYIGPNVVIAKGVEIGDGCVIGANSLVMQGIPAGMKAWGTPCRAVGPASPPQRREER
jgi:acetyltransferase-like isoleucine patch superfamily enzyme